MKWSIVGLLFMGVVAAVSAALLVASLQEKPAPPQVTAPAERQTTLMVAAHPLRAMEVVDASAVVERTVLEREAPIGALSHSQQVIGKVLLTPVVQGQVLTQSHFALSGSGAHLASTLPQGMRAVTVSLSNEAGLRGLLYPGSVVDVLASFRLPSGARSQGQALSTTLLRGVQVLAINTRTVVADEPPVNNSEEPTDRARVEVRGNLVTFLVNGRQAEALQLASQYGTVSLAMRNPLDDLSADSEPTLLHGGRMASWAELMASTVSNDDQANSNARDAEQREPLAAMVDSAAQRDPALQPTPVNAASPDAAPGQDVNSTTTKPQAIEAERTPLWQTVIIRGNQYETREFPMPQSNTADKPVAAGQHDSH